MSSIEGDEEVERIQMVCKDTDERKALQVDGVFVAIGTMPVTNLLSDWIEVDDNGYIVAGEDCKTNVPGIYAAGDVRTKQLRQVVTAVADGANSIAAVEHFLINNEEVS